MTSELDTTAASDREFLDQWVAASPRNWKPAKFQSEREALEAMLGPGESIKRVFTGNSILVLPKKEFLRGVVVATNKRIIVVEKGRKRNRKSFDSRYSEIASIEFRDKIFGASVHVKGLESYRIQHVPDQIAARAFADYAKPRAAFDRDAFNKQIVINTPRVSPRSVRPKKRALKSQVAADADQAPDVKGTVDKHSVQTAEFTADVDQAPDVKGTVDKPSVQNAEFTAKSASAERSKRTKSEGDRVSVIREDVKSLLTANERVERIAHQNSTVIVQRRDAVVCTNNRLIIYRAGWLGKLTFEDFLWQDVLDAHLKEGSFSSTFIVNTKAGQRSLTNVSKIQARRLYTLCQQREQEWRERRRLRRIEEDRAKAGGVHISAPVAAESRAAENPERGSNVESLERLKTATEMFNSNLISESEYEEIRARILKSL